MNYKKRGVKFNRRILETKQSLLYWQTKLGRRFREGKKEGRYNIERFGKWAKKY